MKMEKNLVRELLLTHFLDFVKIHEDATVLKMFQLYVEAHGVLSEIKFPSPLGYTLSMSYYKPTRKRYSYTHKQKSYSFYLFKYNLGEINYLKQKSSVGANFTHSADAIFVHFYLHFIKHAFPYLGAFAVHDCFSAPLIYTYWIRKLIRLLFIDYFFLC